MIGTNVGYVLGQKVKVYGILDGVVVAPENNFGTGVWVKPNGQDYPSCYDYANVQSIEGKNNGN